MSKRFPISTGVETPKSLPNEDFFWKLIELYSELIMCKYVVVFVIRNKFRTVPYISDIRLFYRTVKVKVVPLHAYAWTEWRRRYRSNTFVTRH